jgi:hypothetical protein
VLTNGPRGPDGEGVDKEMPNAVKIGSEQGKARKQRSQVWSATAGPAPPHWRLQSSWRAALPRTDPHLLPLHSTPDVTSGEIGERTPSWLGFVSPCGGEIYRRG